MNRNYKFRINKSEMFEYYEYTFALMPKNKTRVVWIKGSIPVLIGFTLYYFHLYKHIWVDVLAVILSLIWLFVLSNKLWARFIKGQVKVWFEKNAPKASFPEVHIQFKESIKVDDQVIPYQMINQVLPLKHILIFYYGNQNVFIIPNRVIGDEAELKKFSDELKNAKNK